VPLKVVIKIDHSIPDIYKYTCFIHQGCGMGVSVSLRVGCHDVAGIRFSCG
jgi:hypothetical protein